MSDPRFRHTVILMVRHNKDGALGIAINRPVRELPVAKLLDALGLDSKGSEGSVRLFAGGPVQPEAGFIVHSADYHRPGTVDIDGRVAMTSQSRGAARHRSPSRPQAESRRVRLRRLGTWPARRRTGTRRLVHGAGGSKSGVRCRSRQTVGRGDETPHHFALSTPCAASRSISTTRAPTPIWRRTSPTNWSAIFRCGWNGCPTCSTSRASSVRRASMRMAACWRRTATRISGVACATATWTAAARRANAGW